MPKACREHSVTFKLWESNLLARLRSSLMALVCNLDQIGCSHHLVPINSKDMYMSPALLSGNIRICVRRPDGEKNNHWSPTTNPRNPLSPENYSFVYTILVSTSTDQANSHFVACPCLPFAICILPSLSLLDKRFSQGPLQSKRPVLMSTARRKSSVGMCPDSLPRVRTSIQPQERMVVTVSFKWSNDHPNQPSIWNLKLTLEMFISVTRMDCPFGAWHSHKYISHFELNMFKDAIALLNHYFGVRVGEIAKNLTSNLGNQKPFSVFRRASTSLEERKSWIPLLKACCTSRYIATVQSARRVGWEQLYNATSIMDELWT